MNRFDDIIFEKRNKKYGAYHIRKRYGWHLLSGVIISLIFFIALVVITQYDVFLKTNITYQMLNDSTGIFEFTNFDLAEIPVQPQNDPQVDQGTNNNTDIEVAKTSNESIGAEEAKVKEEIDNMIKQLKENVDQNVSTSLKEDIEAQDNKSNSADAHTSILVMETELRRFIYQNTKYPDSALNNKINGIVLIQFLLTPKGEINNITIIKNAHPLLDKEAMRVVNAIPKGKPVIVRGKPVPVVYRIPVIFKI